MYSYASRKQLNMINTETDERERERQIEVSLSLLYYDVILPRSIFMIENTLKR